MSEILFLVGFLVLISLFLAMDLGIFNKNSHQISVKESLIFTGVWIGLALLFFIGLRFFGHLIHGIDNQAVLETINAQNKHGLTFPAQNTFLENLQLYRNQLSLEFLTGYTIEYALSIDNIFVILMIFISFGVDTKYYHRVLFWGIIGAVVMRFVFIFTISALIHQFEWILLIFGALLIYSAIKMFISRNAKEDNDVKNNKIVKFVSKHFSVTPDYEGNKFIVKKDGKWFLTPLLLVLIVIELSDVIFAVDSVPAIFSVTHDSYMVFFSNIFAIIGLRSLFFLLSSIVNMFRFLKIGLSVLLAFVGVKMFLEILFHIDIPTLFSLLIIVGILAVCILLSLIIPKKKEN
ncbi:MAG: TerC/Alx family metal homeostasis membrane protein [Bacteroidales bacterium]|jgi:tellurite resistance protein TerC|nr:TerC/Alx family metal homeostasis membrane protein [Bacteroidales bacterium]